MQIYLIDYSTTTNIYTKRHAIRVNLMRLFKVIFSPEFTKQNALDQMIQREYLKDTIKDLKAIKNKIRVVENDAFRFGA